MRQDPTHVCLHSCCGVMITCMVSVRQPVLGCSRLLLLLSNLRKCLLSSGTQCDIQFFNKMICLQARAEGAGAVLINMLAWKGDSVPLLRDVRCFPCFLWGTWLSFVSERDSFRFVTCRVPLNPFSVRPRGSTVENMGGGGGDNRWKRGHREPGLPWELHRQLPVISDVLLLLFLCLFTSKHPLLWALFINNISAVAGQS